jgi:L-alanine-DL-glutamate epimerase-like enolase superfamily enzyme
VPRRHFDATLVTVETDEGVTGHGSGDTMDGFEPFEPLFTGRDPLAIAEHVRALESIGFHAGRYWPLEAALWDIMGQVAGQPVSVLFGGASRRLPAYASFGEARSPQARAEAAVAAKAAGFRAMKIRISRTDWVSSLSTLRATRVAVGDEVALMADLNQWWRMPGDLSAALDLTEVRRIAAELADLGVFWLEEPLPGGDLNGMRALRGLVRVAGGEMVRTPAELLAALDADALDVLQPDVPNLPCCGIVGSPRTPGPTAWACWPTCTWWPAWAAAPTWSSPTIRPAGPRSAATSSSPSRSASTPMAAWLFPTLPASAPGSTPRP